MHALVIDNDEKVCGMVKFLLEGEGMSVSLAPHPDSIVELVDRKKFHVILLETAFAGEDVGLDFCRKLRAKGASTPIIFITTKSELPDRVAGLGAGADDYIAKPFDPGELVERVKAVIRRCNDELRNSPISTRRLKLDVQELKVTTGQGREIDLTPIEMRILHRLALSAGRMVSRESLMNSVFGFDYEAESNTLHVHIRRLRRKIEKEPSRPILIQTVRGAGYKLVA